MRKKVKVLHGKKVFHNVTKFSVNKTGKSVDSLQKGPIFLILIIMCC